MLKNLIGRVLALAFSRIFIRRLSWSDSIALPSVRIAVRCRVDGHVSSRRPA